MSAIDDVRKILAKVPDATTRAIAEELGVSTVTVNKARRALAGTAMVHVSTVDPAIGAEPDEAEAAVDEGGAPDQAAEVAELKALVEELRNHIVEQSIEFLRCLRVIRQQREG